MGWYRGVVINIFVFLEFVYKYKWIIFLFLEILIVNFRILVNKIDEISVLKLFRDCG